MSRSALRWPSTRPDWTFSPASAAVNIGGALLTLGAVGHAAQLAPVWSVAAVAAAAAGSLIAARGRDLSRLSLALRIVLWVGAGVWLWLALAGSPWRVGMLASLAIGTVAATLAAPALHRRDQRLEVTAADRVEARARDDQGAQWETWLRNLGIRDAKVVGLERWDPVDVNGQQVQPGYTLDVKAAGATLDQFAGVTARLGSLAELPAGAGVEAAEGIDQSRFLLFVATADTLADDLTWEHGPQSEVTDDAVIGRYRSSFPTLVNWRERKVLVVGTPGTGKSTTLHGLIGRAREQVGHLVCIIDLSGGGDLSRPWLQPWLDGRMDRPAIVWVGADVEEGILMAEAVLDIGRWRKGATVQARQDADTTLIPLGPDLPRITIIVDEGETSAGGSADRRGQYLGGLLLTINKEMRNPGCDVWFCALRGIGSSLGSTDYRAHAPIRIQTGGGLDEATHTFGSARGLSSTDTARQGRSWIQIDEGLPRPYIAPNLAPSTIAEIAIRTDEWAVDLDEGSARAAGEAWARRWDPARVAWLFADSTAPAVRPAAAVVDQAPAAPTESMGAAVARMDATAARLRAEREADEAGQPGPAGPADDDVLAGILAATEERESAAVRLARAGDRRGAALALLLDAGRDGIGPKALADLLAEALTTAGDTTTATSRQTVQGWLQAEHRAGRVHRRRGGRYVHGDYPEPADIEDGDGESQS
ncbi:type IV secretion system DNA-binding domain-containing protein [Frankia sp. Mgl5]|uniref:type IV secretion system DNA-binding domain-containing protein n=1 Tax=Frankia sp. Mgl5 TaxID=2933793 RepID=UPI00201007ED|nr:type IV secretion system DNA-binding domain-containing protein [Frankia sp. Mgl5]MCK9929408.1 type IV secretion system DNA-binding domain-containing protein [Frankia sp. Mgl5]